MQLKQKIMKQIISLSIVSIAFDTAEMRRMNRALGPVQTPNLIRIWTATQTNKSTPVDSDVELNSPNLIQFEPKLLVKNRKPKLLVKYVIIIYALGSAHERFGV